MLRDWVDHNNLTDPERGFPDSPIRRIRMSGHGRKGGLAAALDYTRTKTVWLRTSDSPIPDPFVMR